jgi:hypothetical protein
MLLGAVSSCESSFEGYVVTADICEAVPVLSDLGRLISAVLATGRGASVQNHAPVRTEWA